MKKNIENPTLEDDFIDFGEETNILNNNDFMDLGDEDDEDIKNCKDLMAEYNKSHKKVCAINFLDTYSKNKKNIKNLIDLEEEIDILLLNISNDKDLEKEIEKIIYVLERYSNFVYIFKEFKKLSDVVLSIVKLLSGIDFSSLKKRKTILKLIVAILDDIKDWKKHVFILEDAVDVYYINASILNSFISLKKIIY